MKRLGVVLGLALVTGMALQGWGKTLGVLKDVKSGLPAGHRHGRQV